MFKLLIWIFSVCSFPPVVPIYFIIVIPQLIVLLFYSGRRVKDHSRYSTWTTAVLSRQASLMQCTICLHSSHLRGISRILIPCLQWNSIAGNIVLPLEGSKACPTKQLMKCCYWSPLHQEKQTWKHDSGSAFEYSQTPKPWNIWIDHICLYLILV